MGKKSIVFISFLLFIALFLAYTRYTKFVYVNPQVNTGVFTQLSPSVRMVDKVIKNTLKECQKDYPDIKLVYQNAYGSGFLQQNGIPNDLDYAVNVNLGEFKYNGNNAKEVANDLYARMEKFQTEVYNYLENHPDKNLYTNKSTINEISSFARKDRANKKNIINSIGNVFNGKDYVFYSKKQMTENVTVDFPFIMKSNEILVEDLPPISLFSKKVRYNKKQKTFLREITIGMDYSCILINEKTGEKKEVEIVPEAFNGQRLQLYRRFFVPSVFINEYSAEYLKDLPYMIDDEKYFANRIYDYGRMLQITKNLELEGDRPVKLLKRYMQCADIISPVLEKDVLDDINSTILENLNNENISLINDYSTIMDNILKILDSAQLYEITLKNHDIDRLLSIAESSTTQLHQNGLLIGADYNKIEDFNKKLSSSLYNINSRNDLYSKYDWFLNYRTKEIMPIETKIANKSIKNKNKLSAYMNIFENIYKDAGFHKVDLYWLEKNKLGVVKDDFTKTINPKDLHKVALENNLVDVNYVFINSKNDVNGYKVRYSVWIRYNPTAKQQNNYLNLREKLLKDKDNYLIKKKVVF